MITRAYRRPARVLAVIALTAPLAGMLVGVSAAPALASTSSTPSASLSPSPADDVFTDATDVNVTGKITYTRTNTGLINPDSRTGGGGSFHVTGPDGYDHYTTIPTCTTTSSGTSCSATKVIPVTAGDMTAHRNAAWPVEVKGTTVKTFYTNFKPTADPANLAAAAIGRTEVDLSWSYTGTEPDKAGFEIVETHNGASRTLTAPSSACNGTSCGYAITDYATPGVGATEDYSYTVTALRSSAGCGSCGTYTRSDASSSAGAQLVGPPPPPSPTPSPTGSTTGGTTGAGTTSGTSGGSTTGSTGGSTTGSAGGSTTGSAGGSTTGSAGGSTGTHSGGSTGGTTAKPIIVPTLPPIVASRRAFALGFNSFSPSLGIPKLPPLPATTFPVTSPKSDTYQPALPYANENEGGKTTNVFSSPIAAVTSLDTAQLAKSLAVALLLLVCAAHVRLFLSHSTEE